MVAHVLRFASVMVFLILSVFSASAAETGCSLQTLEGTYVFSGRGWTKSEGKVSRPIAYIGMLSYDGKGKVVAKFRYESDKATQSVKGSYTISKNCEAEVTLKNGRRAIYFVSPSGEGFSFVVTSGIVVSGDARRISREMLLKETPVKPKPLKTSGKS